MTVKKINWIEVWIDAASLSCSKEVFLKVVQELEDGSLEVIHPNDNSQVVQSFGNYQDAYDWLREDEYELIEGRWNPGE